MAIESVTYVIVYVFGVHFAYIVTLPVEPGAISVTGSARCAHWLVHQPANV